MIPRRIPASTDGTRLRDRANGPCRVSVAPEATAAGPRVRAPTAGAAVPCRRRHVDLAVVCEDRGTVGQGLQAVGRLLTPRGADFHVGYAADVRKHGTRAAPVLGYEGAAVVAEGRRGAEGLRVAGDATEAGWRHTFAGCEAGEGAFGSLGDRRRTLDLLLQLRLLRGAEILIVQEACVAVHLALKLLTLRLKSLDVRQDLALLDLSAGGQARAVLFTALVRLVVLRSRGEEVFALRVQLLQSCGNAFALLLKSRVFRVGCLYLALTLSFALTQLAAQ